MANRKSNWNDRIKKSIDDKPIKKKNQGFTVKNVKIEEILDESGEVLEDTVIRFSFDGIVIILSVADALRMNVELGKLLNLK
jgi:hypothetical protein